jgi:hypothetical protein
VTPAEIRDLAKDLDFAIDVTEPREVILQRFIDILSPVLATILPAQSEQNWAGQPAATPPADPQPDKKTDQHYRYESIYGAKSRQRSGQLTGQRTILNKGHNGSLLSCTHPVCKFLRAAEPPPADQQPEALLSLVEDFAGWWHLNREGSVNRTYAHIDTFVKALDGLFKNNEQQDLLNASAGHPPTQAAVGPQPEGCINCGERHDGGYLTGFEGDIDEGNVGPFCSQCWEFLGDFFGRLARLDLRRLLDTWRDEAEALRSGHSQPVGVALIALTTETHIEALEAVMKAVGHPPTEAQKDDAAR